MTTQNPNTGSGNRTKYILIGIGTLSGLAIAGYFVYQHHKQSHLSDGTGGDDLEEALKPSGNKDYVLPQQPAPNSTTTTPASSFPLKQGSRGALVVELQNALIRAYCKGILPKYGADGVWGSELTNALTSHGHPTTIDLAEFTKIKTLPACSEGIVDNSSATSTAISALNAGATATALFTAIKAGIFSATLALLNRMKSPADYKLVGDLFKQIPWDGLRRYTLVTAVFTTFNGTDQKKTLTQAFLAMGLKHDDKTGNWSNPLAGIKANVETTQSTMIWDDSGIEIEVPSHTLLGEKLSEAMDIVRFRTADGWDMYVLKEHVAER